MRVNAVDANGYVIATLVGPPAAGLMVEVLGGPVAIGAIGALYAVSALVFLRVPDPPNVTTTSGRLLVDAWLGLRYTLANPTLRALGIALSVSSIASGIVTITVPVIVIGRLGLGEAAVGLVFAVSGISGGIAALAVGRIRMHGRERRLLAIPPFGVALAALAVLLSPTLPVLVAAMALTGFLHGPMDVALYTLRQRRTDPAWMGRAFAVSMSLNFLGYPFGAAVGGSLLAGGIEPALVAVIAATSAAGTLAWLLIPRTEPAPGAGSRQADGISG